MSPLVRIFKDVHIKIMTSQTQPVQGTRSIRKSFFTVPIQSHSERCYGQSRHEGGAGGGWATHPWAAMGDAAPSSTGGLPWRWG